MYHKLPLVHCCWVGIKYFSRTQHPDPKYNIIFIACTKTSAKFLQCYNICHPCNIPIHICAYMWMTICPWIDVGLNKLHYHIFKKELTQTIFLIDMIGQLYQNNPCNISIKLYEKCVHGFEYNRNSYIHRSQRKTPVDEYEIRLLYSNYYLDVLCLDVFLYLFI